MDREYRLIAGLHPTGFPVAKPYGLCTDEGVIGTMFYVMGLADGRNLWDGTLPDYAPADRTAIYEAMCDTLADLHKVDYVAAGLGDYGNTRQLLRAPGRSLDEAISHGRDRGRCPRSNG